MAFDLYSPTNPGSSGGTAARQGFEDIPTLRNIGAPQRIEEIRQPEAPEHRGLEAIFKGVSKFGEIATEALDTVMSMDIDEKLRSGARAIQESHAKAAEGVKQEILDSQASQDKETPADMLKTFDRMKTVESARRGGGAISDGQYWAEMNRLVENVKSRYPGHVRVIDQKIKEITGRDPANAIREANVMEAEYLRQQARQGQDKSLQFIMANTEYLWDRPNWMNENKFEIINLITQRQSDAKKTAVEKSAIELAINKGEDPRSKIEGYARGVATQQFGQVMAIYADKFSPEAVANAMKNPQAMEEMHKQVVMLEAQFKMMFSAINNTKVKVGDGEESIAFAMSKGGKDIDRLDNVYKQVMMPFLAIKEAIGAKDANLLNISTKMASWVQDKATADMYQKYPILAQTKAIREAVGNETHFLVMSADKDNKGSLYSNLVNVMRQLHLSQTAMQGVPMSDQIKTRETEVPKEQRTNSTWNDMFNTTTTLLTNKGGTVESRQNAAKTLFMDKDPFYVFSKMDNAEKAALFTKIITPQVDASMKELGGEYYAAYTKYVDTVAPHVLKATGDTIRESNQTNPVGQITYNPTTNQFELGPSEFGKKNLGFGNLQMLANRNFGFSDATDRAVKNINGVITAMTPALKGKGVEPSQYVQQLIQQYDIESQEKGGIQFWVESNLIKMATDASNDQKARIQSVIDRYDQTIGAVDRTLGKAAGSIPRKIDETVNAAVDRLKQFLIDSPEGKFVKEEAEKINKDIQRIKDYLTPTSDRKAKPDSQVMKYTDEIEQGAVAAGIDPEVMKVFAQVESSGDPKSRTGSYKGLFQLSDKEYKAHGGTPGKIYDAKENARVAGVKLKKEMDQFEEDQGRPAAPEDIYLVHQQGRAGYNAHLENPDGKAWENVRKYYKSDSMAKKAIWGNVPDSFKKIFGKVENMTSEQFVNMWHARISRGFQDRQEALAD